MGSTCYIIPLRSESDEENEETRPQPTEPVTIAFRNKIAPTSPTQTRTGPARSRSPLFRAKSSVYDRSCPPETETVGASVADGPDGNNSDVAKIKRSAFSDKSNSAGASISGHRTSSVQPPSNPDRSYGTKSSKKSERLPETVKS